MVTIAEASTTMALAKLPLSFIPLLSNEFSGPEPGAQGFTVTHPGQPFLACGEKLVFLDQAQHVVTHSETTHARPPA